MKKRTYLYSLFITLLTHVVLMTPSVYSLSEMADTQLKQSTAQAGLSIGTDNVVFESKLGQTTITTDSDNPSNNISFDELRTLALFEEGSMNIDIAGTYIQFSAPDWKQSVNIDIKGIKYSGVDVGDFSIEKWHQPSFEALIGLHDSATGPGMFDFQLGSQTHIETIEYGSMRFSDVSMAESYNGINPVGMFTVGDIAGGSPGVFNLEPKDTVEFYTVKRDPINGGNYDIPNERHGNRYLSFNAPLKGSVRIGSVEAGGNNYGPVAIEGINLTTFKVELPGRGLGK